MPDFGTGLLRVRLLDLLSAGGGRPTVIVAPSGAGKSFLAAQYAARSRSVTAWIGVDGAVLGVAEIADSLEAAFDVNGERMRPLAGRGLSRSDCLARVIELTRAVDQGCGVSVVLDDVGPELGAQEVDDLRCLATALWRSGVRLLVTTRSAATWSAADCHMWTMLDQHDLALRLDEARELAEQLGVRLGSADVGTAWRVTAGNPALFVAVAIQASRYGLDAPSSRAFSLDAWLERTVAELAEDELAVLQAAAALKYGTARDLLDLGFSEPARTLKRIGRVLPLVDTTWSESGSTSFRIHDLVDGFLADRGGSSGLDWRAVLSALVRRDDYSRACELLGRLGNDEGTRDWLLLHGRQAFNAGHISALHRLLQRMPMPSLMVEAQVLILWANVRSEMGCYDESLAAAKAARLLAEHRGDTDSVRRAIAQMLLSLRLLGEQEEADLLAEEVVASTAEFVDDTLLAEALFCIGYGSLARGDLASCEPPFRAVLELCRELRHPPHIMRLAQNSLSTLPAIIAGDFQESWNQLARMMDDVTDLPSTRMMVKGNMALCLVECGRHDRAEALIRSVIAQAERVGLDLYAGAYLPLLGMVMCANGDAAAGVAEMRRGIALSVGAGDDTQAATDRLHLGLALRSMGRAQESLCEAERSWEVLADHDRMGFSRIAAFEVAASMLACNDQIAAKLWIERAEALDGIDNPFCSIRGAMLLAECDLRGGRHEDSVARLARYSEYIGSENPNLLVAMYCRAFPKLLSVVALAVGVSRLPVHMLRLIPPETAECALADTRAWVGQSEWGSLGMRLLGEDGFREFAARDGLPLCHVHFFGGLEVSIGGRSIREKDWRKRKARLLCAMLVLRRGHDVPREQLFEHLFPDLDPERAKNNLYVIWSTMKSVLLGEAVKGAPLPYFEAVGGVCRAISRHIRSDVDDFDRLVTEAARHEMEGELGLALHSYEELSSLYRGELLPGDVYDDWFSELREHYRVAFVNAMLSASTILMAGDDPCSALSYARRAIQSDPLREDLYQVALRCQLAAGQRSGAIETYLQCRSRLAEDLGLDPSAETRALYEQILMMEASPNAAPLDSLSY